MRAFPHLRVLLAALLAVTLLGACEDGDDGGDQAQTTTTAAAEPDDADETTTSETTEDTTEDTSATTDTTTDDTTDTSTDDTTDPSFEGDADSEWCGYYRTLDEMPDLFGGEATSPEDVEEGFAEALLVVDELVDSAPDEIAVQTAAMAEAFQRLGEILARYDWDFNRFAQEGTQEEFAFFEDPELNEASADLEAYASQVCGIES